MIAVKFRGIHIYMVGCAFLYRVHVAVQYATYVKNFTVRNLRLIFWVKKLFVLKMVWNTPSLA